MKYKHSRQELRTWFHINIGFDSIAEKHFEKMLLAQKEDRKECIHKGYKADWHPQFCRKCGAEFMYDFTTPSPLELPKINNNFSSMEQYNWAKQITDEVKKLYQLIKEKI